MKKLLWFLLTGISMIVVSCYDDKGSYDYHDINEVSIWGWKEGGYNVIYKSDTLKINPRSGEEESQEAPVISFTQDEGTPGRYEYEWMVKKDDPNENNVKGQILGTSRELSYFVELAPGTYRLWLKVRDLETGVLRSSSTILTVRNVTDKGFLLLGEDEAGNMDMDMISMAKDTLVLRKLLKDNGLPSMKNPGRIMYTFAGYAETQLWVTSDEGGYNVDPTTFQGETDKTLNALVFTKYPMPEKLIPVDMSAKKRFVSQHSERLMLTKDYAFPVMLYMGEYYGDPVNRMSLSSDNFFKPFPFIFAGCYDTRGWILYDQTNHCFARISSVLSTTCTRLSDGANDVFPWIQPEGRDCVYGENTMDTDGGSSNGNSMALMSDANGFYVYKFYSYGGAAKRSAAIIDMTKATGLRKGLLYSFASQRSLLLYAEGSVLHAYDYQNQRHYSIDMENEITYIGFDFFGDNYDELVVATYNQENKGMLNRYVLGTNPNTFELNPIPGWSWKGLVKVKDVEYKE